MPLNWVIWNHFPYSYSLLCFFFSFHFYSKHFFAWTCRNRINLFSFFHFVLIHSLASSHSHFDLLGLKFTELAQCQKTASSSQEYMNDILPYEWYKKEIWKMYNRIEQQKRKKTLMVKSSSLWRSSPFILFYSILFFLLTLC